MSNRKGKRSAVGKMQDKGLQKKSQGQGQGQARPAATASQPTTGQPATATPTVQLTPQLVPTQPIPVQPIPVQPLVTAQTTVPQPTGQQPTVPQQPEPEPVQQEAGADADVDDWESVDADTLIANLKPSQPVPEEKPKPQKVTPEALGKLEQRIGKCVLPTRPSTNTKLVGELDSARKKVLAEFRETADSWGMASADEAVVKLEQRFAQIRGIEAARAVLYDRVLFCGTSELATMRRDLVDAFVRRRDQAAKDVVLAADPTTREQAVVEVEARLQELRNMEVQSATIFARTYKSKVTLQVGLPRVDAVQDSSNRSIEAENADEYAFLMDRDEVEISGLHELAENSFVATIVSTTANRPPNPLTQTQITAGNAVLYGGRAREHYGEQPIFLDRQQATRVTVNDPWVKDIVAARGHGARSLWDGKDKKWNYRIIVDQVEWKKFHIMFSISGQTIQVFHVGPGG